MANLFRHFVFNTCRLSPLPSFRDGNPPGLYSQPSPFKTVFHYIYRDFIWLKYWYFVLPPGFKWYDGCFGDVYSRAEMNITAKRTYWRCN